jgi:hypothetical protein
VLLAFLLDHDGVAYTRAELFQANGISMKNFNRDFPQLLRVPFVTSRTTLPVTIRARLSEWAKTAFGGVDLRVIKKGVMRTLE